MPSNDTHRVFFALWPDNTLRQKIRDTVEPVLASHPARRVPLQNWHITLAFLGDVNNDVFNAIQIAPDSLKAHHFHLQLSELGFWKRPQVVWLGCKQTPQPLLQLVDELNNSLACCGYVPEHRKYTPHLTLLRKASRGLKLRGIPPIDWPVHEFVLVESQLSNSGSRYAVVKHWPLA